MASSLLERYEQIAYDLSRREGRRAKVVGSFVASDLDQVMADQAREWPSRMNALRGSGVPLAGLGFAANPQPNTEPVNAITATPGGSGIEANLYTPATTTNADWALMPLGSIRCPQTWLVYAAGTFHTASAGETMTFTSRIGTSGTPSSNVSLGATGAINPSSGAGITGGAWMYEAQMTITKPGTSGTAIANVKVTASTTAAGAAASVCGMAAASAGTFDTTIQQGYVISLAYGTSASSTITLNQFVMIAID